MITDEQIEQFVRSLVETVSSGQYLEAQRQPKPLYPGFQQFVGEMTVPLDPKEQLIRRASLELRRLRDRGG